MKNSKKHSCLLITLIIFASLFSNQPEATGNWKSEREQLDNVHTVGKFRIFYTLKGENSLTDPADYNGNSIPDIVENIGLQLYVADRLYRDVFGFTDPLTSKRYLNKAKSIDVHILSSKYKGESGDGVIKYNYRISNHAIRSQHSLTIIISNAIKASNLTPAHELIHSYQNGYTMFKNRWFTEGTARWIEYAFKEGTGKEKRLPDNAYDLQKLLASTYDAQYFWNRLFHLCSENEVAFPLPSELRNITYVGTGQSVIEGDDLYGAQFMLNLLKNLDLHDDFVTNSKGFATFKWKETEQKSPDNNRFILMALKKTILNSSCASLSEIRDFLDIIDLFLQKKFHETDNAPDFTNNIEYIGNPYEDTYKGADGIYARNIWDMTSYKGLLFIGGGNTYNIGPAPNAGPVPIFSYDPRKGEFKNEILVDDEQIFTFAIINDIIYIPGADATESHEYGNYYLRGQDGTWQKMRNIPGGLHVFTMNYFDQRLMAGISTKKGAGVAISENNGIDWQVQQIGEKQSTYGLLVIGNELYAVKQFVPERYRKKWPAHLQQKYCAIAQYNEVQRFIPRPDLSEKDIFPDILLENQVMRIIRSLQIGDKALYIGGYNFRKPFGIFLASSLAENAVAVKRIKLPMSYTPRDILSRGDTLYLLCSEKIKNGYLQKVIKISLHDVNNYQVLFQFSTKTFARSFEEISGDFYFGLGSDIKDPRNWSQDEISPDTGKILRIRTKNLPSN